MYPTIDDESHNFQLVLVEDEQRVTTQPWGERVHPTARQYAVHQFGIRVGTLLKWWFPAACSGGAPGGWEWVLEDEKSGEQRCFDKLSQAKRFLRV